ncbi:helicase associated domain-containing protein [Streptomyces sp. NBC_01803]|uniref:helicase associated domain-containing protein n=1 Tax=Streptomyces sp. NBC_01803 TaxID=2975946 RepID=UPI002DDC13D0|nr:helicase associated domain-containing protein [Streptomyces sp. NBC_01803]WSA42825.1 helicase associated domain-containing protein [Streptomyces sp. NBC_01803]
MRTEYAGGRLDKDRVDLLNEIGMVWSAPDLAWEENIAAAKAYFAVDLLPVDVRDDEPCVDLIDVASGFHVVGCPTGHRVSGKCRGLSASVRATVEDCRHIGEGSAARSRPAPVASYVSLPGAETASKTTVSMVVFDSLRASPSRARIR